MGSEGRLALARRSPAQHHEGVGKPKGESRGLEFLKKVRPAAMDHLLSFFAESARNLDPKTRFLISVVTKVISGSPRGVQQYVRRAMENGARADEVIDAVLCAYPCAGLTKVVDAVDVILDMGIDASSLEKEAATEEEEEQEELPACPTARPVPRAAPREEGAEGITARAAAAAPREASRAREAPDPGELEWFLAGQVADIPPVGGRRVIAGHEDIAVFLVDEEFLAIGNRCPHRGGSLCEGTVMEGIVTCPLHRWRFDVRTGQNPERPVAIRTFPVKMEGDQIFIGIPRKVEAV